MAFPGGVGYPGEGAGYPGGRVSRMVWYLGVGVGYPGWVGIPSPPGVEATSAVGTYPTGMFPVTLCDFDSNSDSNFDVNGIKASSVANGYKTHYQHQVKNH